MVHVIKDTYIKDINCFSKIHMKQRKNTWFSSCPGRFETNRKVPAFLFEAAGNFSNSKPRPPGKESWAKTRSPGSETCESRWSPRG